MKKIYLLILILLQLHHLHAQEKTLITINMKSGDKITGYSELSRIPFITDYGNLSFPVEDVRRVVLGINSEGIDRHVLYGKLDKIRFGSLEESERAFDQLVNESERVLPMMRDYMDAPDYQSNIYNPFTVELLYRILLEKFNLGEDYSEYDVVHFKESYSIEGEFKFEEIFVRLL